MMTQDEMNLLVPEKLKEIEKEYNVTVLWAVESGSRAWGFASPDSDFDVRFIYKRNASDYLKLNPDRDVIELPIDDTWDVSGWDLDKTLKLLQKSNPTLYEWLQSPIAPITSSIKKKGMSSHIVIGKNYGLSEESMILLEQTRIVNIDELASYVGTISDYETLNKIENGLTIWSYILCWVKRNNASFSNTVLGYLSFSGYPSFFLC